jgi:hypothetical protein
MSEYWSKLLKGSSRTELKHQTTFQLGYATSPEVVKTLPTAMINSEDFTFANVLKAAWAYVLAKRAAKTSLVHASISYRIASSLSRIGQQEISSQL